MKPAVIAGGSENPPSNPGLKNNTTNDTNINNPNAYVNTRQFPNFQPGFGFNEPDVDDMFSNVGLRSRLNRMRDPFAFGARKRCGNDPAADPYSRYFNDDDDFFPSFGQTWDTTRPRRRVVPDQQQQPQPSQQNHDEEADIFGRIPSEFRHYIPDGFGFGPRQRHPPQKTGGTPPSPQQQQYSQQPNYYPQQQQQAQPQYYEQYPQPGSPTVINGQQPKPKLCDAAIQTEDLGPIPLHDKTQTLKQHGLRNTVDLGIKSPQEECRSPRAQSAPPNDAYQTFANANAAAANSYPDTQNSQAQASASNDMNGNQYQQTGPEAFSQGTQMTPPTPPPRQNIPQFHANPQQQSHQSYSQPQPRYEQNPSQSEEGSGFVRTVPIFVEGRSTPVINKDKRPPPPQTQQQHQEQRPQGQQNRPTPLNTQNLTPTPNQVPPQTPHTAECINKIQDIQRDVLDLMSKVENFKGLKNDKDYMYLDEMLTRNLLKLDTIDTNGKESIRLARREAIKCIQASINVLEAKSEENLKTAKRESVMENENNNLEEIKPDETNDNNINKKDEIEDLKPPPVIVALPPPPDHNPSQEIHQDESKTNDEINTDNKISSTPIILKPEESQLKPILEEEPVINPADTEQSSTETVAADSNKTEKDDVPEIETRTLELPKKKIIRKVKKGEKKTKTSPADTGTDADVQKQTPNDAEETPKP